MKNILIVCTANKARSPIAMEIARKLANEKGLSLKYNFMSAGITVIGSNIDSEAATVLKETGIITEHTPMSLKGMNPDAYDEIHVMTERQKLTVMSLYNVKEEKIKVLGVDDPYGKGINEYRQCRDFLERFYNRFLDDDNK